MNRITRILLVLGIVVYAGISKINAQETTPVKVMTTNIRYANPNDGINVWDNRKDWLCNSISFMDVDVFGAQEVLFSQLNDMKERLPHYNYVGVGRNGEDEGEFCPVFYKKDKYELLDHATFWLSETPEKVNSKGWDAALPRIVTWVELKDKKTDKVFYVFNTHFDHKGTAARLKSAELLIKKVKEIAPNTPFLVTGDFNFIPSAEPYPVLTGKNREGFKLKDSRKEATKTYGPSYTTNGFNLEPDQTRERIDYIFFRGKIQVLKHHIVDGQRGPKFISDHFPVVVDAVID